MTENYLTKNLCDIGICKSVAEAKRFVLTGGLKALAKKYSLVVLQGLKEGNKFYSLFSGDDPTIIHDGTIAYKILLFTNSDKEAQMACGHGISLEQDYTNVSSYLLKTSRGAFTKAECDQLATVITVQSIREGRYR